MTRVGVGGCNQIWGLSARPGGQERGLGKVHLSGEHQVSMGPGQGRCMCGEVRTLGPAPQRAAGSRIARHFPFCSVTWRSCSASLGLSFLFAKRKGRTPIS